MHQIAFMSALTKVIVRAAFTFLIIVTGCSQSAQQIETDYVGRVIDITTQQPIVGVKITLDLDGVPSVAYTDSEGVYQFVVKISSKSRGQIRADAVGYQTYTRNIILPAPTDRVDEIRLTRLDTVTPLTPIIPIVVAAATETLTPTFTPSSIPDFVLSPILTISSTPSQTSTPVSIPTLSSEIKMMDQYYRYINNAGKKDDIQIAWDFLTRAYRCRLYPNCKPAEYLNFWWVRKVHYKLYDCGPMIVEVELVYYYRDPAREIAPALPEYVKYFLVNDKGNLRIDGGEDIVGPEAGCRQVVSSR